MLWETRICICMNQHGALMHDASAGVDGYKRTCPHLHGVWTHGHGTCHSVPHPRTCTYDAGRHGCIFNMMFAALHDAWKRPCMRVKAPVLLTWTMTCPGNPARMHSCSEGFLGSYDDLLLPITYTEPSGQTIDCLSLSSFPAITQICQNLQVAPSTGFQGK